MTALFVGEQFDHNALVNRSARVIPADVFVWLSEDFAVMILVTKKQCQSALACPD